MYDVYPSKCNICGGEVEYKKLKDVGLESFQSGWCYICTNCGAYVGTHKNRPKEALGILAHKDTRRLRMICHEEFDRHWTSIAGKNRAYYRLSKLLGIPKENCHFGHMDNEMLLKALEAMQNLGDLK